MNDVIMDRYIRQNSIDWLSRDKVKKMAIAVIGAGAIGNEVIKNLTLLGIGQIDVFDFDRIEIHNLTRSVLFNEKDIGKNKADCAVNMASSLDPNVKLAAYNGDFWNSMSLSQIKKYNVVISCVDNYEARIKLNKLCLISGVDLINTGIDSRFVLIEWFPISKGPSSPCFECNLPLSTYQTISRRYSCGWIRKKATEADAIPTTIITSSIAGSIASSLAIARCSSPPNELEATRFFVDSKTFDISISKLLKNNECGGCSHINERPIVLPVQNSSTCFQNHESLSNVYFSSDQIIISYKCKNGCKVNENDYRLKLARHFDDSVFICPQCRANSIELQIKDHFTGQEIIELFSGAKFPAKYVMTRINNQNVYYDLEV